VGGEGQSFQKMVLGQINIHTPKFEVGSPSHTILIVNSKWIKALNVKTDRRRGLEDANDVFIWNLERRLLKQVKENSSGLMNG
jgi:hypothetical protein